MRSASAEIGRSNGEVMSLHVLDIVRWRDSIDELIESDIARLSGFSVSEERLSQGRRFLRREDARRCIAGELIRHISVSEECGPDIACGAITYNRFGKPGFRDYSHVEFNLSHSGDLVLFAIDGSPVGIDVEEIRGVDVETMSACLTERERAFAEIIVGDPAVWPTDDNEAFFFLWTMKESLIKCVGTGLFVNPLDVEITPAGPPNGAWKCRLWRGIEVQREESARWSEIGDFPATAGPNRLNIHPVALRPDYAVAVTTVGTRTLALREHAPCMTDNIDSTTEMYQRK